MKTVSLEVRAGEVVGINGLVGAGRTEAMQVLFGDRKKVKGLIYINGKKREIN